MSQNILKIFHLDCRHFLMKLIHNIMMLLCWWKLTSHMTKYKVKFGKEFCTNMSFLHSHWFRLELVSSTFLNDLILWQYRALLLISSQCLTSLLLIGLVFGFSCLNTVLIAAACAQFQKVISAILDIRQQHIKPHYLHEDEQVLKSAKCNLQAKLNACIQHHKEIFG